MLNTKKTVQDILQEEMLRERAAVLARAGERLSDALEKLAKIESEITAGMAAWRRHDGKGSAAIPDDDRHRLICELNGRSEERV